MKDLWMKDGVPFRNPLIVGDRAIYNPTPEELTSAGYSIYVPPAPEPEPEPEPEPIDRTAFDSACQKFRAVCAQIGAAIGDENFRGGFDEMAEFQQSEVYGTLQGLQLAMAWSAANELCKYEGSKIGLGQPEWWYDCWRGAADQSADESAQQSDSQNDEPLTEPVEGAE